MTNKTISVVWDLDGTLMDTLTDLMLSTNYALRQCGMPERTNDEIRRFVGNGVHRLIERAVPEGTANEDLERCFTIFQQYYVQHCKDNTKPYDGIIDVITTLHHQGVRQAIVSNKLQAGVTELHNTWFKGIIDVAIGETPDVQRKPAPDMVHKAMRQINASSYIYIGDSDVDLATARNAGLPCISVLWGFRDKPFLLQHGATTFAETPSDLLSQLLSLIS